MRKQREEFSEVELVTYTSVLVKQKTGRMTPITKQTKPCPVCSFPMYILTQKKGGIHKRNRTYWVCEETFCGHREMSESTKEKLIRMGLTDE